MTSLSSCDVLHGTLPIILKTPLPPNHKSSTSVTVPFLISKRKPKTFKPFLRYGDALMVATSSTMDCFILHKMVDQRLKQSLKARKAGKTYSPIDPNTIASTSCSFSGPARSLSFDFRTSSVVCVRPQSVCECGIQL